MSDLAPELPQLYTRLLQGIPPEDMPVARRALKWLICVAQPLKLKELVTAAAIVPDELCFDPDRRLDQDDMLLDILGSLVKVNQTSHFVEIAHYSIIDYLTTPTSAPDHAYYLDLTESHGEILQSCYNYIHSVAINPVQTPYSEDSLLRYATAYWPYHSRRVEHIPGYCHMIIRFLQGQPSHATLEQWKKNFTEDVSVPVSAPLEMRTGLFYAALLSLPNVVEFFF